ncbi:MAG TPA: NAD+ synthase, partial [Dissulfurispiraceae bacterium]|nr:NAD+ synthase [Dissulfurispiraceae bacterium]
DMNGVLFGVNICEDIWYPDGPTVVQALAGAELIININASPFHIAKSDFRRKMLSTRASENSVAVAYLNTVGGQDELVFDGHSFVIDQGGEIIAEGKAFEEDLIVVDIDLDAVLMKRLHDPRRRKQVLSQQGCLTERVPLPGPFAQGAFSRPPCPRRVPVKMEQLPGGPEEVYRALVLGTGDYVRKNRFTGVCIGLSGGIDSSIVAAVAVDAIGHEHVTGIFMPSPYTSVESREDVRDLAGALGIRVIEVPIDDIFKQFLATLGPWFSGLPVDTTEENIQARIRGNILMAFSNKFGWLVLTTGNKSEMSVGYATLYGDMAGGFAVIKDVPKTLVYDLCQWRNAAAGRAIIPERVLVKAPTAELKPDQRDTDTLPPYDVLDPILRDYIEKDMSHDEIVRAMQGCGEKAVRRVLRMVDTSEYKRRQSPPGVKITPRAFGKDRRFPITNRYEG